MAKNKKIKDPTQGQITYEMLSKSKVERIRDSSGKVQYALVGPLRRFGHWINPAAGYVVKPVGGWKTVDGRKCANEVMLVYQHRVVQKALIALGIVGAATPVALELVGMLQEGPVKPDDTPKGPTYSWVCNCDENCRCKKDKDQTTTTPPPTTSTTPSEKEEEDEGGFVVKDPVITDDKGKNDGYVVTDKDKVNTNGQVGEGGEEDQGDEEDQGAVGDQGGKVDPYKGGLAVPPGMQEGEYSE